MAGSKRERDLHRAKVARQEKEAAEAAELRKRRLTIGAAVVGVIAVIALVAGVAIAGGDSDGSSSTTAPSPSAAPSSPVASATSSPDATAAKVTCTAPTDKKPNNKQASKVPSDLTLQEGTYEETLTTNCGVIKFTLESKNAPNTTKAMLFLTDRQNFYANTSCHRLTTEGIYVLQCGDPNGDGTGGPGFAIPEENLPKADANGTAVYERGTVAMANAGKDTTGSQFFLVYKDSPLPPNYTVIGKITEGLDILDHVAAQGTTNGTGDGPPKQPVQIDKMTSSLTYEAQQ